MKFRWKKGSLRRRGRQAKRNDSCSSDYAGSTPSSSRCDTPEGGLLSPSQGSFVSPTSISGSVHSDLSFPLSPGHLPFIRSPKSHMHHSPMHSTSGCLTQSQEPVQRTSPIHGSLNSRQSRSPINLSPRTSSSPTDLW